jgi:hypothetical protein
MRFNTMARRTAAAGALCGLLGAGGSQAQTAPAQAELFATFKSVCADNAAAFARTTAAPEVQSWKAINFPFPMPAGGGKLRRKAIRVQTAGKDAFAMFFAGTGDIEVGARRAPFEMCAVGVKPADLPGAVRQVQAWTGQTAQAGPKNSRSVRYHLTPDGRRSPVGPGKLSDVAGKLGPGSVVSVDVVAQAGATVISYSIIKL